VEFSLNITVDEGTSIEKVAHAFVQAAERLNNVIVPSVNSFTTRQLRVDQEVEINHSGFGLGCVQSASLFRIA
jgi:hypothetical protein